MQLLVLGTDTAVGKTAVTRAIVTGRRRAGHTVWVHKPVACGDWDDGQADDGRAFAAMVGDGQDPGTACPHQWPEACSPHLAAAAAGDAVSRSMLSDGIRRLQGSDHDLIVEGAGGPLVPLTEDLATALDVANDCALPCVLVTRPHLGTLNHTCLAVEAIIQRGVPLLGLIVNHHEAVPDSLATRTVANELERLSHIPVLAEIRYATTHLVETTDLLARVVTAAHAARPHISS